MMTTLLFLGVIGLILYVAHLADEIAELRIEMEEMKDEFYEEEEEC